MSKLYAIVFEMQKDQIGKWCWGSCGYGIVGALDFGHFTAIGCKQEYCPHLDKQSEEPFVEMDSGAIVYLRKLKDLPTVKP